MIAKVARIGQ